MPGPTLSSHEPVDDPKNTAKQVRAAYADDNGRIAMPETAVAMEWQGTDMDRKDMSDLGKVQELRVSSTIGPIYGSC